MTDIHVDDFWQAVLTGRAFTLLAMLSLMAAMLGQA